jgi:hypothetical protein
VKRKKRNKYPFILLLVVHTSLLVFTIIKRKDRKTLLTLMAANMGFAYLFEYFVLNLFHAYKYKPRILKKNYFDNILGAILSQAVYIPFTAAFVSAFRIGWIGKALFVLYFHLVERLFLKWKIYKTRWWNPIYTSFLLPIYFKLSDKWYEYLRKGSPIVLLSSLFLAIMGTGVNIIYLAAVTGNFRFGKGILNKWKKHFVFAPLYSICFSLITAWSIRKDGWAAKFRILTFFLCTDLILYKKGYVKKNFQIPFLNVILHVVMIGLSEFYKRFIYRGVTKECELLEGKKESVI